MQIKFNRIEEKSTYALNMDGVNGEQRRSDQCHLGSVRPWLRVVGKIERDKKHFVQVDGHCAMDQEVQEAKVARVAHRLPQNAVNQPIETDIFLA